MCAPFPLVQAFATNGDAQVDLARGHQRAEKSLAAAHDWIEQIEAQPGIVKAMDAEMLLQQDHPILEDVRRAVLSTLGYCVMAVWCGEENGRGRRDWQCNVPPLPA